MPSLSNHQSNLYTKCLFIGDSKSGKTGALTSLVAAGYKLRILDFDNGLDVLKQFVLNECPDKIGNVEFRTLQDKRKATSAGSVIDGTAQAFIRGIEMMDKFIAHARLFDIPMLEGEEIITIEKAKHGFTVKTKKHSYKTKTIIYATGTTSCMIFGT